MKIERIESNKVQDKAQLDKDLLFKTDASKRKPHDFT